MTENKTKLAINFEEYNDQLFYLSVKYPTSYAVLLFLANNMDDNNIAKSTKQEIIDYLEKSRQTINKAINVLEKIGFIEKFTDSVSEFYILNKDVFQKS